jgi:hypothetical protein
MTDAPIEEVEELEVADSPSGSPSYFLWGFGPLAVAVVLFVLMVLLAPSVAPERIVEQPVNTAPAAGTPGS